MGILSSRDSEASASDEKKWDATRVNDSLYELHRAEGTPNLQIIFFHGLQLGDYSQAHMSTWESGDGSVVWPQTWLAEEFPRAQVLSVSCNDGVGNSSTANMDVHVIAENLIFDLLQAKIGQLPFCPVVLVGHSVGGLVIKQVCLEAHERVHTSRGSESAMTKKFLASVKGIFYYSTPHYGLHPVIYKLAERIHSPYVKFLSTDVARLSSRFDRLREVYEDWMVAGVGESRPTKTGPFSGMLVVLEASSRGENYNVVEGADHFSVCKPASKTSRGFVKLKSLLQQIACNSELEQEKHALDIRQRSASLNRTGSFNNIASINRNTSINNRSASIDRTASINNRDASISNCSASINNRTDSIKKDKEEWSSGPKDLQEELPERGDNGDADSFEWYDDPLTWEKMCDPVKCSDGRTYDRWTILDQRLRRSPYDPSITEFGILCDDISTRSRLFKAFPEQELRFHQRRKTYREEALRHARSHPIEYESAVEKLRNVLKWLPLDKECQRELHKIQP